MRRGKLHKLRVRVLYGRVSKCLCMQEFPHSDQFRLRRRLQRTGLPVQVRSAERHSTCHLKRYNPFLLATHRAPLKISRRKNLPPSSPSGMHPSHFNLAALCARAYSRSTSPPSSTSPLSQPLHIFFFTAPLILGLCSTMTTGLPASVTL